MSIVITPIPRTTQFSAPAFSLSTSNSAGSTSTTVASNSTLAVFDSSTPANIAGTAATGSAAVAARRDHVHKGVFAVQSAVVQSSRTASAGSGDQAFTGLGFQPTCCIMLQMKDGGSDQFSLGIGDGDDNGYIGYFNGSSIGQQTTEFGRTDSNPNMTCTLKSLDTDGFTLNWIKYGAYTDDIVFGILAIG
jgi:hypothetical protein